MMMMTMKIKAGHDQIVNDDETCDKGLSRLHPPNRCLARTQLLRLDPPTFSMTTMMIKTITMIRMITMIMMITMRLPLEQRFKVVQEGEISVGCVGHRLIALEIGNIKDVQFFRTIF